MRIFIGTVEQCQWINTLANAYKQQGHKVITYSEKESFFDFADYTLRPQSLIKDFFRYRFKSKNIGRLVFLIYQIINKLIDTLFKRSFREYVNRRIKLYLYKNTDVYIQLWAGLERDDSDLLKFKENGAKIITLFAGSEIRDYEVFKMDFKFDFFKIPQHYKSDLKKKLAKLRNHELYSDAIFSVPDQSSLALRPFFHLQIPLNIDKYKLKITHNKIPVIIHIPSNPEIKGSAIIEKAIQQLKEEGLEFIYISKSKISNNEVLKLLSDADILIDELILHGPGVLSFEAMLSGCAVATRYYLNSPDCFKPPVVSIDEVNIVDKIRKLILDYEYRIDLIKEGRKYAEENNNVAIVSRNMLNAIESNKYDYYPSYYRNEYIPEKELEVHNSWNNIVKNCHWYKQFVSSGERAGLKFL